MKVSYLIPLFNKVDFIESCIDSILLEVCEQFEIEICIVDDGSTDGSFSLVSSKYGGRSDIKMDFFHENKGKNAACNRAYELATGDYICPFGADDIVVGGRTKKMLSEVLAKNKSVYGGYIAKNGDLSRVLFVKGAGRTSMYDISMHNSLSGGCVMLTQSDAERVFPVPEHLKFEDWWIAYRLLRSNRVGVSDDVVTVYRIHGGNDCGTTDNGYASIRRDYLRHFDYINCLMQYAADDAEIKVLEKSLAIRKSFFGEKKLKNLLMRPYDQYWFKIFIFTIMGAQNFYKLRSILGSIVKNQGG